MKKRSKNKAVAIFAGQQIRRQWDEEKELWYFAVVDVVAALTGSNNPQVYWRVLKKRLIDEGSSETVTKCNGLKMLAPDGKMRLTDVADTEVMLRLVQSIPSIIRVILEKILNYGIIYIRVNDMCFSYKIMS